MTCRVRKVPIKRANTLSAAIKCLVCLYDTGCSISADQGFVAIIGDTSVAFFDLTDGGNIVIATVLLYSVVLYIL